MVTVGIKAYNEEKNIAASIRSALAAVASTSGNVVLADSGSTDRTVEIAKDFPIMVVQLSDSSQRCCGAGAQLAFQYASGDYFYLLDGDMTIDPEFLSAGMIYLEKNPDVAAVGGIVEERNLSGQDFQIRRMSAQKNQNPSSRFVDRLDCGGLYRCDAIRQVEYFSDRNLHSFEEFDLGARLRACGWKLARIDKPAVSHFGHQIDGYKLLWRRLRSGYSGGAGEVLRGAIGRPHLSSVVQRLNHVRVAGLVVFWWGLILLASLNAGPALFATLVLPIIFLIFRRRSIKLGAYSFTAWNVSTIGTLAGFFRKRVEPTLPLSARVISDATRERPALLQPALNGAPVAADSAASHPSPRKNRVEFT